MVMQRTLTTYLLLSGLLSSPVMANDVDSCLREYESRYNTDSEAGEVLPPMRNLYPDWEEDCHNGGILNTGIKAAIGQESAVQQTVKSDVLANGFQAKWKLEPRSFAGMPSVDWVSIISTTDHKVHIQKIIINKGRCNGVVSPGYLLNPATTVDYGQGFKIGAPECGKMLELTIETDIGSVTINPYG